MPIWFKKDMWATEVGLNILDIAPGIPDSWPLGKPRRIAAALSDSNVGARVQERDRVMRGSGEFERKMWLAERFLLLWDIPNAREQVEAMAHDRVRVHADADLEFRRMTVTAQADRRRAELRHVSSIGSCSTLLTKIGPAIVSHQAAAPFLAPARVDDRATTSGQDIFAKWRVQKRAFVLRRKRQRLRQVPLQVEADVAGSIRAGSCGGRWQGHLFFICPPFSSRTRSGEVEKASWANGGEVGEPDDLQAAASGERARAAPSLAGLPSLAAKLHPDCEPYGRVPPNMPHPPLPPNPPTGRPNAPARTHSSL